MKLTPNPRRAAVLQVLAVLAAVCLTVIGLAGLMVYRTLTVGGDLRAVRGAVLQDLRLTCSSKVEVSLHPWLVGLARTGLSFAPLEPEARLAIQAVRGAEVGYYQLGTALDERQRRDLFEKVNQRLEKRGWERMVTVLGRDELVLVYTPTDELSTEKLEAFVLVLNGRELVLVSGGANLEPILELAATSAGPGFGLPVR